MTEIAHDLFAGFGESRWYEQQASVFEAERAAREAASPGLEDPLVVNSLTAYFRAWRGEQPQEPSS